MKRLLFRATRGRAILTTFALEIEQEDIMRRDNFHSETTGFIVLIEDNGPLRKIVERVCHSFSNNDEINRVFEINPKSVAADLKETIAQKCQLRDLIAHSKQNLFNYLLEFVLDDYSLIQVYKQLVNRDKTIYKALNMFKDCDNILVGLVWVPKYRKSEFLAHISKA